MSTDHFNAGAGGSYARNLREENAQLGSGQQQLTGGLLPKMFDAERDGPQQSERRPEEHSLGSNLRHGDGASGGVGNADGRYNPTGAKRGGGNVAASVWAGDGDPTESMNEEQKFPMMSMRRITKLPYIESGGEGMLHGGGYGNEYGGYKSKQKEKAAKVYVPPEAGFGVSRSLGNKQSDIENQPTYYGALKEHMREMGPENVAPIHVQPRGKVPAYGGGGPLEHANLGNGGHRVAIAMELGWTHMRTTSEKGASGYAEEDEYGKGEGGEDSDAYYNEQSSADIDSNPYPGVAGKEGEFGGAYVQGGRGRRAQPTGGTGGPREWAHPPNSARDNVKQKAWGTGPIQEQNARIQGYGGGQRSDRRPGDGQQELKLPRPVPDPYVSEQQFGAVKHKSLTSAIAAGDRAGELARYKRIHAADERP